MANDEVLTEGEIDALMETVDEGNESSDASDDGEFRRFDFAAREQSLLREFTALTALLERQAELLGAAMENVFSLEFSVRAQTPSLMSVADVLASLERAVAVSTTTIAPLAGPAYAVAPASLMSFVVNAYFGGGATSSSDAARDSLTPTELRLAERIADQLIATLTKAWQDKLPLEAGDITTLGVPDRIEMLPRSDVLLKLSFELGAGEFEGKLHLLLPFAELEPYQLRFAPPRKKEEKDTGQSWEPYMRRELPSIDVDLAAVLTSRAITLADLLQLKEGEVIPIPPPEQVSLQAENMTLAEGRYGSFEGAKAVQLQRLGNPERD